MVSKHGYPIFIAVSFDEALVKSDIKVSLAVGMFVEHNVGLTGAAKIAGVSPSEMMDILAERKIPLVDYSKEELADELKQFIN